MPRAAHTALIALGAVAALAAPVAASASSSLLFSQQAPSATTARVTGTTADLTMATGHAPVMAFEERPGRRTGTLGERHFLGLWKTTFASDAPNALLTGTDAQGRSRRAVVEVTRATRTASGVRYRVRSLRGSLPTSLRAASLMIDSVPTSAVSAALLAYLDGNGNRVAAYVPIINALRFPMWAQPQASPSAVVTPGNPMTVGAQGAPQVVVLGGLTMFPTSQVRLPGAGVLSLTFANPGQPCDLPAGLAFAVTVTGSDGSTVTYPGLSYTYVVPGPSGGAQSVVFNAYQGMSGMCTLVWNIPPAPKAVPSKTVDRIGVVPPPPPPTWTTYTTTTTLTYGLDTPLVLQQVRLQTD